ncbi:MAG: HAMP domain-containing protein [Planctomycetes bacterium]|nr:HAMP domain-containing protein [Planctomycetota bacterium]
MLGFGLVILSFFGVAAYSYLRQQDVAGALEEIHKVEEAGKAGLQLANYAREKYIHEAHVLLGGGPGHEEHYQRAEEAMERWLCEMRSLLTDPEEMHLLEELDARGRDFDRHFQEEILPVVRRGEQESFLPLHHKTEEILDDILAVNETLSSRLDARIENTAAFARGASRQARTVTLVSVAVATLLALSFSWLLAGSIVAPIRKLVAGTEAVGRGALNTELAVSDPTELGQLAASFNRMTRELRDRREELVRARHLASLGELAAGVAHEINNPISVILGYVQTLRKEAAPGGSMADDLATVEAEALQCQRIVRDLLDLARPVDRVDEPMDVREVLEDALETARRTRAGAAVKVRSSFAEGPLLLDVERRWLKQLAVNLVNNAYEAMPEGGELAVEAGPLPDGGVHLVVSDTGVGIPAEHMDRIFDPFFTTKGAGTGLGLAICYRVVTALGGRIDVASRQGEGARFAVSLPGRRPGETS